MTPEEQKTQAEAEAKKAAEAKAAAEKAEAAKAAAAGATPNSDGTVTLADGKVQVLSPGAYKRIKEDAAKRGAARERAALEEQAKAAGFASLDDALRQLRDGHRREPRREERPAGAAASARPNGEQPPTPPERPTHGAGRKAWERYERARKQFDHDVQAYRERTNRATARARDLEKRLEAQEAEQALREKAIMSGVTDVDYAIALLKRDLSGKTEEELGKFDEAKWFEALRASKPYLFGVKEVPANTGTAGTTPAPATPGQIAAAAARDGQFDGRKVSKQEFNDRLQKMGISSPTV